MKSFLLGILHLRYKKYLFVLVAGVVIVGFLGENSVRAHMRNAARISLLQADRAHYESEYDYYQNEIFKLRTDAKAVEQRARQLYFVHSADEDVFVLSDDQPHPQHSSHETVE